MRTKLVDDATRPFTTDLPVLPVAAMTTTRMGATDISECFETNFSVELDKVIVSSIVVSGADVP